MYVTFHVGDRIEEYRIKTDSVVQDILLPGESDVLAINYQDDELIMFVHAKGTNVPPIKRKFMVLKSGEEIVASPETEFRYPHLVGSSLRKGLHVFELV